MSAIVVENLSKRYVIEHESRHDNLRDTLHHAARKMWRRFRWGTGFAREEFWALRGVSFQVEPGEVVGVIGRNGAGKSTLLKILSRITPPTSGRIRLRGRVASLLEVGTGFHPDLTGRENIFLNGAILGMTRAEIRRKFDEIVAFAGVERFLDTPVKRYSSGMYVRLAFAVAAHLEPEILIVDEVLAVGDAEFQQKCLGKMRDFTGHGRTVVFVSHNLAAIENLTQRTIVLDQGLVHFCGPTHEARESYLRLHNRRASAEPSRHWGRGRFTAIRAVKLTDLNGSPILIYHPQNPLYLEIEIECEGASGLSIEAMLKSDPDTRVAFASLYQFANQTLPAKRGRFRCLLELGPIPLASGRYWLDVATSVPNVAWDHTVENALSFDVALSWHPGSHYEFKQSSGMGVFALPSSLLKFEPVADQT